MQYDDVEYVIFDNGWFYYAESSLFGAQAVDIKFADSDFSLLLFLPNRDNSLSNLEASLKGYDLMEIINRMRPNRVTVKIPIFQMKYQTSLRTIAKQVGLKCMNLLWKKIQNVSFRFASLD